MLQEGDRDAFGVRVGPAGAVIQVFQMRRGRVIERIELVADAAAPDGATEVVLNLENRLRGAPARGSKVNFEGVASALTKEPFRLTLTGDAADLEYALEGGRGAWLQVTRGGLVVNGTELAAGDGAAIENEAALRVTGGPAEALVFDLA